MEIIKEKSITPNKSLRLMQWDHTNSDIIAYGNYPITIDIVGKISNSFKSIQFFKTQELVLAKSAFNKLFIKYNKIS